MNGLLTPGTDNESLKKIADEATKPFYKKIDWWLAILIIPLILFLLSKLF
ncbi:MAG: hypothetical protein Q8L01_01885 [Candidatus Woesebacteria bacterium]|nr:hypothetical protein [Candidatus Woesebacteria bacterium]